MINKNEIIVFSAGANGCAIPVFFTESDADE